jgi:hypothetical protein
LPALACVGSHRSKQHILGRMGPESGPQWALWGSWPRHTVLIPTSKVQDTVRLFNLEGSAIFGPGSEWFWSMAQFVLVAITLLGIYVQLRIARSANAFEQINRLTGDWESERTTRHTLEVYLALRDRTPVEDIPEGAATFLINYWENVAALVRAGHVDRRLVYEYMGSRCRWWWLALAPNTRRARMEAEDPTIGEHFEWLAGVMAELDREGGVGVPYDDAHLYSTLDRRIQNAGNLIQVAEDLRSVRPRRETKRADLAPKR